MSFTKEKGWFMNQHLKEACILKELINWLFAEFPSSLFASRNSFINAKTVKGGYSYTLSKRNKK